jgi:hypothetical protein
MSDNTNDTSAIDDKKIKDLSSSSANLTSNISGFMLSLIIAIIIVIGYFSSSGLILYLCKLAQSNILPTETDCFPYTDNNPTITPIKTNIFTTFTDPEMSMKLEFPYDNYNSKNKVLEMFRKYKYKPSSNFLANYFISIIEQLINFNYSSINTVMNALNAIPEIILVAIGPIIVGFLFGIMLIINFIYTIYLWFVNMSWFFKTNTNDTGDGLPKWEDISLTTPVDWGIGFGLVILFVILFFIGGGLVLSVLPFIVLLFCGLTSLMYNSLLNGKKATALTIIKEVLKYYKLSIVSIISLFIVSLAFSKLGTAPGIFSIITIGLIYWGIISIDIFNSIPETNLTPVVSYEQASKKCSINKSKGEEHGLLYNLLFGQKGGNITKQLKKINKTLLTK